MRIDAQRNHDHILAVARDLLATSGTRVSIETIARAAGVGVGTVNRHFPTKERLLDAVLTSFLDPILDASAAALAAADPVDGLETFLVTVVDYLADHRALAEEMREVTDHSPALAAIKDRVRTDLAELLARGQAAGTLRADIGPDDLRLVLAALAQAAHLPVDDGGDAPTSRLVRIVVDGLRSGGARPFERR